MVRCMFMVAMDDQFQVSRTKFQVADRSVLVAMTSTNFATAISVITLIQFYLTMTQFGMVTHVGQ